MQNFASHPQKLVSLWALACALAFSLSVDGQNTQNAAQTPCPATTGNGSTGQATSVLAAEKQNLQNAGKQLGALFKKKSASTAAASANPCPPPSLSATANPPASAGTPVSAPALATAGPAQMAATPSSNTTPMPADSIVYQSTLVPPAPPGGLDPSKLPDILGIHIGTPTDQVVKQLNDLYPIDRKNCGQQGSAPIPMCNPAYSKYVPTNDPLFVSNVAYGKPNPAGGAQSSDTFFALFSGPPEKLAVELDRTVTYAVDQPASDTLRNAAIQKYGPNFVEYPPLTLTWAFDEQGKPLPPLPKASSQCGMTIISQQGFPPPNPNRITSTLGISATMVAQREIDRIVSARCMMGIVVKAQIIGQPGGVSAGIEVKIMETAQDMRNAFAAENYLRQAAKANANQQLKNAQKQAAPTF